MKKLYLIIFTISVIFTGIEAKSENLRNENVLEADKIEYINDSGKSLQPDRSL